MCPVTVYHTAAANVNCQVRCAVTYPSQKWSHFLVYKGMQVESYLLNVCLNDIRGPTDLPVLVKALLPKRLVKCGLALKVRFCYAFWERRKVNPHSGIPQGSAEL